MESSRPAARINAIATAVPDSDVQATYREWARRQIADPREAKLFERMCDRAGIEHRWSILSAADARLEPGSFYARATPPGTAERMRIYATEAPALAIRAIDRLFAAQGASGCADGITHLVVASCTGFVAPGIDQIIARKCGLSDRVERVLIGFMGCYAGAVALRTARHIAQSDAAARVLVVTVELSSLHLQPAASLEPLLAMLQFGDGAAAALVSTAGEGLLLGEGLSLALEHSDAMITWTIGDSGFAMHLSGEVPARLAQALADPAVAARIGGKGGIAAIDAWAVHAGGRSILDAVQRALDLPAGALDLSRDVLRDYGNMSSGTLLFALQGTMARRPANGVALAFGPGLAMEGFRFGWSEEGDDGHVA
ncbi:type III polyketide synthase [Croceicoccus sp. F390]|uniref:Type III polyketide synthase n=1 Tax=Croceicoccus esteveae TaxID=3075597 RepID=A0ABU2ZHX7_9SPHN|nr:type III polyketide synthase [Croceicoccus sp. F390]MDT0575899.1 type III polyketide synthase [Croceicoccus sp. F390]